MLLNICAHNSLSRLLRAVDAWMKLGGSLSRPQSRGPYPLSVVSSPTLSPPKELDKPKEKKELEAGESKKKATPKEKDD